jgi:hypothetical protein
VDTVMHSSVGASRGPSSMATLRAARRHLPAAARVLASLLVGATWTLAPACAVLAPLAVVSWWSARSRVEAGAIGAAYQLGATYGLSSGAAQYLSLSPAAGAGAIVALALVVGLPWAITWTDGAQASHAKRLAGFVLWLVLTLSPIGFGALMVAHPVMAAGWWFPGFGWVGLGLTALLLGFAFSRASSLLIGLLSVTSVLLGNSDPRQVVHHEFAGLDTRSEPALGELDFAGHYRVAAEAIAAARVSRARVVVLPEGSAGAWTLPMASLWEAYADELEREGRTLVVGASTRGSSGELDNSAVVLGADGNVVVPQRLPIPVAMWRPWSAKTGFQVHPWAAGTVTLGGRVAGVIVCWEGALVLPVLLSVGAGAEVLVHLANHAWVGDAGLPTVVATRAFGALFNVPVVIARNAQGGE